MSRRDFRFWLENNGVPSNLARKIRMHASNVAERASLSVHRDLREDMFIETETREQKSLYERWKAGEQIDL